MYIVEELVTNLRALKIQYIQHINVTSFFNFYLWYFMVNIKMM